MIRVRVGPLDRIPTGEGRELAAGRCTVAVFRPRGGGFHVTQARCPHKAGPLADGLLGETVVVCPMHGYRFDVATGQPIGAGNDCPALRTYAASLDVDGELVVELPDEDTADPSVA
jgi:nitrite reductase (NADH) small subunit